MHSVSGRLETNNMRSAAWFVFWAAVWFQNAGLINFTLLRFLRGWQINFENLEALVRPRYYCPPDFVRLGNGCYHFSSHIASWQNAHFSCRDLGAQLGSLDSRWEDSTIRSYLSRPEFGKFLFCSFKLLKISFGRQF